MPILWPVAAGWLTAELAFLWYQKQRYTLLSSAPPEGACVDRARGRVIMERLLAIDPEVLTLEDFFSGWFRGAPYELICRENVLELTAYGFWNAKPGDLSPELLADLEWYVSSLEEKFQVKFPTGYNHSLRYMGHLQEPLRVVHNPFVLHLCSEGVTVATSAVLRGMHFRFYRCQGFKYWIRQPKAPAMQHTGAADPSPGGHLLLPITELRSLSSVLKAEGGSAGSQHAKRVVASVEAAMGTWDWDTWHWQPSTLASSISTSDADADKGNTTPQLFQSAAPLVFLHGVGLGLTPYIHFIWQLMRDYPMRPIVLLECPHVSLSLCSRAVTPDVVADAVVEVLRRRRWQRAAFVAHSYGTFVLSRIVQKHQSMVESMVLIDPVCMFTMFPQLLRNFIYRLPRMQWRRGAAGIIDGLRYVVSRNLVIAEAFGRKFAWHKVMLWPEEMAAQTLLVLSAGDDLVPSALVQAHLQSLKTSCQVICHPTAPHGGFLFNRAFQGQVLEAMRQVLSQGSVLAAQSHIPSRL
ncbi:hypothetical protein WJX73_001115 [Symbiochloris irregularis]|uniref:AB hydrolase-1 domain-containing protein n=1 Tax=Symbiochloris irregularis TaxID=706552 RepID=A0AAW1PMV6_9CHLO